MRRLATLAVLATFAVAPLHAEPPTPAAMVDAFEGIFGKAAGVRRSHAKGLCAEGEFTPTADAKRLSVAPIFAGPPVAATIRFAVGGGTLTTPDTARSTRGLSIRFETRDGDLWDVATISVPIFGSATPEMLYGGLRVRAPDPATGQPNQAAIAAWVAANPQSTNQGRWIAANLPPASFATTPYWSANAFRFQGADGKVTDARFSFEPAAGTQRLTEEQLRSLDPGFLTGDLQRRVAAPGGVSFTLQLQIAGPGDTLVDPTVEWPADRPRVTMGTLRVTKVGDPKGACDPISYLNLEQSPGIEAGDDPVLKARAAAYAEALTRRLQ